MPQVITQDGVEHRCILMARHVEPEGEGETQMRWWSECSCDNGYRSKRFDWPGQAEDEWKVEHLRLPIDR